jgi:hypothetical protein
VFLIAFQNGVVGETGCLVVPTARIRERVRKWISHLGNDYASTDTSSNDCAF